MKHCPNCGGKLLYEGSNPVAGCVYYRCRCCAKFWEEDQSGTRPDPLREIPFLPIPIPKPIPNSPTSENTRGGRKNIFEKIFEIIRISFAHF